MIENLRISDLGVIAQADLELGSGMTALSGETGAGKTMALTSLELILGGKADASRVRKGSTASHVEGTFVLPETSPLVKMVEEAGGEVDVDNGEAFVMVARHVPASGRSTSYLGGRRVPTAILANIAKEMVTVHGQSDQMRLTTASQQRQALDTFGAEPLVKARDEWQGLYRAYEEAREKIERFDAELKDLARQRLMYETFVAKVDAVAPRLGEEEELKEEARRLESSDSRYTALSQAAGFLSGDDAIDFPALAGIDAALRALEGVDEPCRERLENIKVELDDVAAELALAASRVESDPERLSRVYSRRQELAGLRKELGMGLDEAIAEAEEARVYLADMGDPQARRVELEEDLERLSAELGAAGKKLTKERVKAARLLSEAVETELHELALVNATFEVRVTHAAPSIHGEDAVTFMLAPHAGADMRPVATAASGGELSRVMLALEVTLAAGEGDSPRTFLFDEVDSGIGGKAAQAVGQRLAELGRVHQVIVVTHLAQVAAYAGNHLVVVKREDDETTRTDVVNVKGQDRIDELARMLSGNATETARAHAAELLSCSNMAR